MAIVGPLSGSFVSFTRFAAVLFPTFMVFGKLLSGDERRPLLYASTGALLLLQVTLLLRHATFKWAG